jgi:toxin ParE1/3/4
VSKPARYEVEADAEYRSAGRWYEARVTGLGFEFFDAVDATVEQIGRLPGAGVLMGRVPVDLQVRWAPVKRFPYRVVYLETESIIRILAIVHERRRPGYWMDRL